MPLRAASLLMLVSGSEAAACHLEASKAGSSAVDPYLFSLNTVLGPIVNLSYSDRGVLAAMRALGVGSLRYPGGTVANYWDLRVGRYTGDGGSDCRNGTTWNYCTWQDRIDAHPAKTFTPAKFWSGAASASGGAGAGGPVWDLNVFSLPLKDQLAQVDVLKAAGVPVTRVELGNEFYLGKGYTWKFMTANDYMKAVEPVISKVRDVFPEAIIAVVLNNGNGGGWNKAMAKYAPLFDAVTIHKYSPGANDVSSYDASVLPGVVAGWGDVVSNQIATNLRTDFFGKQVWRTEFNYPTWNGGYPLPELKDGALHGIYWASNVLAAIERYNWNVPIRAVMLHAFAAQDGITWDGEAGIVQLSNSANDVDRVRVSGVGQIFAHVSRVALQLTAGKMFGVSAPADSACGALGISIDGISNLGCIQAAAFAPASQQHAAAFVVLNKCAERSVTLDAASLGAAAGWTLSLTSYRATDAGGWAPLPEDASELPWATGPLQPSVATDASPSLDASTVTLPEVSLTIAVFSPPEAAVV